MNDYIARFGQRGSTQKSGGGFINWRDEWRPPKNALGDPILLVDGHYQEPIDANQIYIPEPKDRPLVPFYHVRIHKWLQKKDQTRDVVCRAGFDPEHPVDCVPCFLKARYPEWARSIDYDYRFDKSGSPRDSWLHNLVILKLYHRVVDPKAKVKPGQEPRKVLAECTGRGCEHCKEGNTDFQFGRRAYWVLGKRHYGHLMGIAESEAQQCASCGKGHITTLQIVCGTCGTVLADAEKTRHDQTEVEAMNYKRSFCVRCGNTGFPNSIISCDRCDKPVRTSVLNQVLYLNRTGEKMESTVTRVASEPLDEFVLPKQFQGKNIRDLIAPFTAPIDFAHTYIPSTKEQAFRLNEIENPFAVDQSEEYDKGDSNKEVDYTEDDTHFAGKQPQNEAPKKRSWEE